MRCMPLRNPGGADQRKGVPLPCLPEGDGRCDVRVLVPLEGLEVAGPVGWFASSDDLRRGFCTQCGSTMFSHRLSLAAVGLTVGTLNDPDRFQPAEHIWTSSMQRWIRLDDGLPQYSEGVA